MQLTREEAFLALSTLLVTSSTITLKPFFIYFYIFIILNPDKTEFILIGTKSQRVKFKKYFPTKLLDEDVTPTDSARNLGVEFDKDFNFKKHISKICRTCYYHICDLRRLRRCLTAAVTKTIATSLVIISSITTQIAK